VKGEEIQIEGEKEQRNNLRPNHKTSSGNKKGDKKNGKSQQPFSSIHLPAGKKEDHKNQQNDDDLKNDQPPKSTQLVYGIDDGLKEPFKIDPLCTFESIRERIDMGYGLMLPYPFSGLEMPPVVKRYYLLGGKEGTEPKKDDDKY
jgi:hypothetical protein